MAAIDSYVILLIGYVVLALIKKVGEQGKHAPPRQIPQDPRAPATMEELLREMQGQLEVDDAEERLPTEANEPVRLPVPRAEPAWDVEERESLEVEAQVYVRPDMVRAERVVVDQDDAALGVANRRIVAAEARNRAWSPEDHRTFDARIRSVAPARGVDSSRAAALRQAIVWREVLGKPIALRDDR